MNSAWPERIEWEPIDPDVMGRLEACLQRWSGTPYREMHQAARVGVDCVRFVCAVADQMSGKPPMAVDKVPSDRSLHDALGAMRAMRSLLRRYGARRVSSSTVQPGDVVIVGPKDGGPGHAMILGTKPNQVWQSSKPAVHYTGFGPQPGAELFFGIFRVDKKEWEQ